MILLTILLVSCEKGKDGDSSNQVPNPWTAGNTTQYPSYPTTPPPVINENIQQDETYVSHYSIAHEPETSLRDRLQGKLVGAHQGGAYAFSANTVRRFEEAYQAGVDIVEMDLRLSKDGVVVVSHDDELGISCGGKISEKTWDQIDDCRSFLMYGLNSFEEVLKWSHGKVVINAEFKTLDVIIPAIKLINQYNAKNWVFFQAKGDRERYNIARGYDKDVALLFVVEDDTSLNWVLNLNDDNLVVIEVNEKSSTPYFIDAIHKANKLVLEDSWHYSKIRELFGATCLPLFLKTIDIAITDRPNSCLYQRDHL